MYPYPHFSKTMIQKPFAFLPSSILSCVALTTALTLAGCNAPDSAAESSTPSATEAATETTVNTPDESAVAETPTDSVGEPSAAEEASQDDVLIPNTTVSEQGLGVAQLGMTLGELKQALPDLEFIEQSPFIVDFDAIAVRHQEETLFYILHLAGSPLEDSDRIQGLLTDHSMFKTTEDVGVGTPIHAAEVPYGKAILSYNTGNESREYVRFENHPATNISFGTQKHVISQDSASLAPAGIYETSSNQYNETDLYQADAAIEAILIVCLSAACSQ